MLFMNLSLLAIIMLLKWVNFEVSHVYFIEIFFEYLEWKHVHRIFRDFEFNMIFLGSNVLVFEFHTKLETCP
jgi:hypothetical protein